MTEAPEILLAHHLKTLKLPTFLREYDKLARPGGERRQFMVCAHPRGARPNGSTMSASSPGWSSWNSSTASGG